MQAASSSEIHEDFMREAKYVILVDRRPTMMKTIEATFDGAVFRPTEPVLLEPNTRVKITFKTEPASAPQSFLDVALSLNLDGPPDWSARVDDYLYGDASQNVD
jgi:predicted DNA-binding antitoxin AbrB/MazE fold protein